MPNKQLPHDRCMELLNQVIDHVSVARNTAETIHELLHIGFDKDELTNIFNFDKSDVENAITNDKEYEQKEDI